MLLISKFNDTLKKQPHNYDDQVFQILLLFAIMIKRERRYTHEFIIKKHETLQKRKRDDTEPACRSA